MRPEDKAMTNSRGEDRPIPGKTLQEVEDKAVKGPRDVLGITTRGATDQASPKDSHASRISHP